MCLCESVFADIAPSGWYQFNWSFFHRIATGHFFFNAKKKKQRSIQKQNHKIKLPFFLLLRLRWFFLWHSIDSHLIHNAIRACVRRGFSVVYIKQFILPFKTLSFAEKRMKEVSFIDSTLLDSSQCVKWTCEPCADNSSVCATCVCHGIVNLRKVIN